MEYRRCFFIGHREASEEILPALTQAIEQHISEYGVTDFIVGSYGGFDRLVAAVLAKTKERHPHITLTLLLPYHPAERQIELPKNFDRSFYPTGMERVPRKFAILRANRFMVDHADYLIAYAWHPASNAQNLLEYALKREKKGLIHVTRINCTKPYSHPTDEEPQNCIDYIELRMI